MRVSLEIYERARNAASELLRKRLKHLEAMDAHLLAAEIVTATLYTLDPSGEFRAPLDAEAAEKKKK